MSNKLHLLFNSRAVRLSVWVCSAKHFRIHILQHIVYVCIQMYCLLWLDTNSLSLPTNRSKPTHLEDMNMNI